MVCCWLTGCAVRLVALLLVVCAACGSAVDCVWAEVVDAAGCAVGDGCAEAVPWVVGAEGRLGCVDVCVCAVFAGGAEERGADDT